MEDKNREMNVEELEQGVGGGFVFNGNVVIKDGKVYDVRQIEPDKTGVTVMYVGGDSEEPRKATDGE